MNTVWRKVWRDLAHNKARTALVVLSIAVGVFALDVIFLQAWVPVHMTFRESPFDETLEDIVLHEPCVADMDLEFIARTSLRCVGYTSTGLPAARPTRR